MEPIREKLRSESGASILLALLFFLLCAMVGASVLMAAASNAGKSRSGREEQQKYLTLSSAMQLVCDELTAAEYTAKYSYTSVHYPAVYDPKTGALISPEYTHHKYEQKEGMFACELSGVLPLREELDWLFAEKFYVAASPPDTCECIPLTGGSIREPGEKHMLTLSVPDQADKPGLGESVALTVQLTKNYKIYLSASLGDYAMYAELSNSGVPKIEEGKSGCDQPIKWQLSQITREEPT